MTQPPKPDFAELSARHTYHAPKPGQPEIYDQIRSQGMAFACLINGLCPNSREAAIAHQKVEEAVFWANAAVARRDEGLPPTTAVPVSRRV